MTWKEAALCMVKVINLQIIVKKGIQNGIKGRKLQKNDLFGGRNRSF